MKSLKEKTVLGLLFKVWDHKLFIICVSIAIMFVFVNLVPKKIDTRNVQSISLIKKPPNLVFGNFVNTYESFFYSLYSGGPNEFASIESNEFYDSFRINIISVDNFINFFAETKNSLSKNYATKASLQNKFGFLNKKLSDKRSKGTNSEAVFFIHEDHVKGSAILDEYIMYCFNQTLKDYKINKLKQFSIVLGKYEAAKTIAKKINLENPFYLDKEIDFKNQQLESSFNSSKLYFRGYIILQLEIDEMRSKIDLLGKNRFYDVSYDPIVDTSYEVVKKQITVVSNYVKGLIIGFLVSLLIIYFKSLLIKRRKSHSI
tara:strand:+ start:1192 stop:2139 length:948 start_codon:yes stop_codon:yes gene_type:complete